VLAARIHQGHHDRGQVFAKDQRAGHRQRRHDIQPELAVPQADDDLSKQREQNGQRSTSPDPSGRLTVASKLYRETGGKSQHGDAH